MNFHMQPVTVAIADSDRDRRAGYERLLKDDSAITLLSNVASSNQVSNGHAFVNRRLKLRTNITPTEDEVARIKRLKPLVLLVNLNLCADEDFALLLSLRRECPEALMVLLTDDSVQEYVIMQALEIGVRGYLKTDTAPFYLSKAIQLVGRGEAWISRKMLGNIMDHVMN